VISDYLESLAQALDFDRSLSRCVRQEVEDHLCEAVAADPAGDRLEAERRAIANFGDPRVIAAQFAALSLAKQTRRVAIAIILVMAAVFTAMKARVAWYAVAHCAVSDDVRAVCGIVGSVDRYAFWLAVLIGIGGSAYICGQRVPPTLCPAYRRQLRRFFFLCTAAAAALVVSVTSDAVLTAIRLLGADLSAEFLVPLASMAVEIACAGVLVFQIRCATQRAASTAALLEM
jgi:hypothetical protein